MDWLRKFMAGRYGRDSMGNGIFLLAVVFALLGWLTHRILFSYLSLAFLIWGYFRILSRNITARYAENQKFLGIWLPLQRKMWPMYAKMQQRTASAQKRYADKEHRYLKCPQCKAALRVPRGKGKISVTCPKCGNQFITKS